MSKKLEPLEDNKVHKHIFHSDIHNYLDGCKASGIKSRKPYTANALMKNLGEVENYA